MKVKLGEVARENRETLRGSKRGLPVVGLEHITPSELTLNEWDVDSENTFTKAFRKGQVLFGRRRAYLKKAAVAPFDGICSGDITVIEAIPEKLLPELLPFVIQNDAFFDYAVAKSAGSLSPRAKWEHLRNFELTLPSLAEQRKLADLLWAVNAARVAYKKLLVATDELIKSQFIEMFGDPITNPMGWEARSFASLGMWQSGGTPSRNIPEYFTGDINWYSAGELNERYLKGSLEKITSTAIKESAAKLFKAGSMMVGMYDTAALKLGILVEDSASNQACANILPNEDVNIVWLYEATQTMKENLLMKRQGCRQRNLSLTLIKSFEVPLPPIDLQIKFANFVQQVDKSKFAAMKLVKHTALLCHYKYNTIGGAKDVF